ISMWDINLQKEVYLDDLRGCYLKKDVVRRYHTAKVKDQNEMTVVVYEGQYAEEEFKKDVAKYMKFRHPSFLQLFGIVHSGNYYASIFHDALIPWRDIERIYCPFPVVFCYLYASAASYYFKYRFGSGLYRDECTFFLRPSTGRLCIDLEKPDIESIFIIPLNHRVENISPMTLPSTIDTQIIIHALTIEQYHKICNTYFAQFTFNTQIPLTATVHLGAVYHTTGHHDPGNPVAIAPTLDIDDCLDRAWYSLLDQVDSHITESGWNRPRVGEEKIVLYLSAQLRNPDLWLSQANHILNWLGLFSKADNYALLNEISFRVQLDTQSATPTDWHSLDGFLFLCPPQSLPVGPASFKCPECVGYWSLDPLGEDQLSSEQAAELGLPTIQRVSVFGYGREWNNTVYAGLRQFHQGKGFDPNSQDLARHLGIPIYELYSDHDNFMDVDGEPIYHIDIPAGLVLKRKYAR
ncbi:hypothetical protein R3P38DRAFT_2510338, partial [Favolaschia claudopus]